MAIFAILVCVVSLSFGVVCVHVSVCEQHFWWHGSHKTIPPQ